MLGSRHMRGWVSSLVLLPGFAVPAVARAQATHDAATAEALFVEGKRLMQKQDYANACPKLAESQRIDPASGTVFALALCYEGAGMIATAWATFNDALAEAKRSQRPDRAKAAEDHLRALEARMTRLRIDVPSPAPGIEVTRNGAAVGKVLWSTAIPVDPGMYTFEAHAPGRVPWKFSVNVDKPGELFTVAVPELAPLAAAAPVVVPLPPPPVAPVAPVVVEPPSRARAMHEKRSYLVPEIGFGVAGGAIVVGAVMGVAAKVEWNNAQAYTPQRVSQSQTAGTEADACTGLLIVGGALAAASAIGVAVIHSSELDEVPSSRSAHVSVTPMVGPSGFGLSLGGAL